MTEHFKQLEDSKVFYDSEVKFIQAIIKPLFKDIKIILNCKNEKLDQIQKQIDENLQNYQHKLDYYSEAN